MYRYIYIYIFLVYLCLVELKYYNTIVDKILDNR